jgi:hypothetical protein
MDGVVGAWVDAALNLEDKDLKMMHRLVRAQTRRSGADAADEHSAHQPAVAMAGA